MKLTTPLFLLMKLRMHGAVPTLPHMLTSYSAWLSRGTKILVLVYSAEVYILMFYLLGEASKCILFNMQHSTPNHSSTVVWNCALHAATSQITVPILFQYHLGTLLELPAECNLTTCCLHCLHCIQFILYLNFWVIMNVWPPAWRLYLLES